MTVRVVSTTDRSEIKRFARLERDLNRDRPLSWAEPVADVAKRLSGRAAIAADTTVLPLVASDDGRDVARCAAVVNRTWQEAQDDRAGGVGYLAAADGAEPQLGELFERAEAWLAERGCDRAIAPFNGGALQGLGLLTDAYDESPMFPFAWHPPWLAAQLELHGYRPTYPFWVYDVDFTTPEFDATSRRALDNPRAAIRRIDRKRFGEELEVMRHILNVAFSDEWEFHPYSAQVYKDQFGVLRPVLDPRMIHFAEVDGEPAGLCMSFPDWTPLFRTFRGRLGPLQIIRFILRAKRATRAGVLAIAVLPEHRGRGLGALLLAHGYTGLREMGFTRGLYYLVNDHNVRSRRLVESFGGVGRVLYTCYDKPLG